MQYHGWDDEYLVYNDLSGDTHLLGAPAIEILLALKPASATRQALMALLKAEFDIDDVELEEETDALLEQMKRLYLVDTIAC
ncbi:hypothetical protein SRABI118_02124 [Massilia sp. Bi118]|nr:hypothetical protein SRABI118_02124 [Massilia sp. Bi118]